MPDDDGKVTYKKLGELTDLPPLMEGKRLGDDLYHFPNRKADENKDQRRRGPRDPDRNQQRPLVCDGAFKEPQQRISRRAAQPLVYTLGVLLVSSLITFLLVWRFTRPIANLSDAARQVAEGNLQVRVADAERYDEMGRLAQNFNEMTAELEKKRELEAQLQQAEKSAVVGRLGSAIAHEIRNPLNYINLTLDHLRSTYAPDDPAKALSLKN